MSGLAWVGNVVCRTGELGENRIVSGATVARRNKAGNRSRALSIEERLGGWGGGGGEGGRRW